MARSIYIYREREVAFVQEVEHVPEAYRIIILL